jgi:anti-sigma factor RsiW
MSTPEDLREYACQELVELVTMYLEGALTPGERAGFEAHLAGCTGCRNYVGQVKATVRALGRPAAEPLAPAAREGLLNIFRDWKRDHVDS